jgi:hypothetical protein
MLIPESLDIVDYRTLLVTADISKVPTFALNPLCYAPRLVESLLIHLKELATRALELCLPTSSDESFANGGMMTLMATENTRMR